MFELIFSGINRNYGDITLKTEVINKWLYPIPNGNNWIAPFDCSIKYMDVTTWEAVNENCAYQIHTKIQGANPLEFIKLEMMQHKGVRRYSIADLNEVVIKADSELSCYFKGRAFNPRIILTLEKIEVSK